MFTIESLKGERKNEHGFHSADADVRKMPFVGYKVKTADFHEHLALDEGVLLGSEINHF